MRSSLIPALAGMLLLCAAGAAAQDSALLAKAQAGNAVAEASLGDFYAAQNTPKGYTEAAGWYEKSADQGDPKAEYQLGIQYCWHEGVPTDYSEAYYWIDLAIAGKVEDSNHWLDFAASHMTAAEVTAAKEKAHKWLEAHPERHMPVGKKAAG